jgi:hypothetical protein
MTFLAWAFLFSGTSAGGAPLFTEESCDSISLLGAEFVELELAGARWQGGDSPCLSSLRLKTMPARKLKQTQDPGLLDPEYLVEGRRKARVKVKGLESVTLATWLGKKPLTAPVTSNFHILKWPLKQVVD